MGGGTPLLQAEHPKSPGRPAPELGSQLVLRATSACQTVDKLIGREVRSDREPRDSEGIVGAVVDDIAHRARAGVPEPVAPCGGPPRRSYPKGYAKLATATPSRSWRSFLGSVISWRDVDDAIQLDMRVAVGPALNTRRAHLAQRAPARRRAVALTVLRPAIGWCRPRTRVGRTTSRGRSAR